MKTINFYFHDRNYNIRDRGGIKHAVKHIFSQEKRRLEKLNYVFCSDKYLLEINKAFLKHDYYTDIITFDLSVESNRVEGEIYVSLDRVIDNAKNLKIPIREEICRVIFHGALHLCGYKDKTKKELEKMREKENQYLHFYLKE